MQYRLVLVVPELLMRLRSPAPFITPDKLTVNTVLVVLM